MRKSIGTAVLAILLAIAGKANADTNLVVNGGFETGNFSGWTLSGNTSDTLVVSSGGAGGYTAHSGDYYAALGAVGSLDFLSQTTDITTIPGDQYQVSFWLISNGTTPNEFGATFNGQTLFPLTSNIPSQPWTQYTYNATATGTSAALTFSSRNDPNFLGLDDVSVVDEGAVGAVPLPASVWGGGVLLGVLGILAYRRRAGAAA